MSNETMGRLISVHTTRAMQAWVMLPFMGIWLCAILVGIRQSEAFVSIFAFLIIAGGFLSVGLPGLPAQRLAICENGMLYSTFFRTRSMKWADITSIRFGYYKSRRPNTFRLKNDYGLSITLQGLSDWTQLCEHIMDYVEPSIYQNAINQLERGGKVGVTHWLQIARNGLVLRWRLIEWRDIDYVLIDNRNVVIGLRWRDGGKNRFTFDRYRTPNGVIYAKLIRDLWQEKRQVRQLTESAYIVIDGIHFNSEGEMIQHIGEPHA
ncbi:MAG: PH domain-containing protein [Chloroflexi bacterium]|nr:PH domain-containing protein [Chloroflexota bacterium]